MYIIMLHAWFSKKQIETMKLNTLVHKDGVYKVYVTKDGEEVRASMVSDTMEHHRASVAARHLLYVS